MKTFWLAVLASVVGGVILWALFSDFPLSVVAAVWLLIKGVWGWSWTILLGTYSIPGWAILLGVILTLAAVLSGRTVLKRSSQPTAIRPAQRLPDSYTEDTIDGIKWRWRWIGTPASIENLWCFCQECDSQLLPSPSRFGEATVLICERCPRQNGETLGWKVIERLPLQTGRGQVIATIPGQQEEAWRSVKREILRKVRTGEWQSANVPV